MSIYGNHEFRVPKETKEPKSNNEVLVVHHYSKLQWDEWLKKNKGSVSFAHGSIIKQSDLGYYPKNKIFIWPNK